MCTIAMHWIEAEKMTRWRSGENNEREEKEEKKSKRGGAGEKKRQMVERTGKRKIQNKREKVEEVCTYCYIWDKRSEDCRNKIFLGLSLNSLLIFAHRQGCSLNHGFVEREQQMGHPSMELFLTTGHRMKIQFHSPQVNSANGIFCRTYLINWQKKGLKWNNVLLAILGKAKCAGRIFRFNPNSWIERVSIRECFRSRDRGWEIFGDRVWGRNNN